MSRRHLVDRRLSLLDEIRGIVTSLKTLARMETQRLTPVLPVQQQGLEQVRQMARDFAHHQHSTLVHTDMPLWVVIGSERGLCGDFNRQLQQKLDALRQQGQCRQFVCVGTRLGEILEDYPERLLTLPGASIGDEVPDIIRHLLEQCAELAQRDQAPTLALLYQDGVTETLLTEPLLSPFQEADGAPASQPLLLNLPPRVFLQQLLEQYLYRVLLYACYASLLAENEKRSIHLENAVSHLDDQHERLVRQRNRLHQEDIIAEIENILLAAEANVGA